MLSSYYIVKKAQTMRTDTRSKFEEKPKSISEADSIITSDDEDEEAEQESDEEEQEDDMFDQLVKPKGKRGGFESTIHEANSLEEESSVGDSRGVNSRHVSKSKTKSIARTIDRSITKKSSSSKGQLQKTQRLQQSSLW